MKTPRCLTSKGYLRRFASHHPYANGRRLLFEHVMVAEVALGRQLPTGAVVHHVNNCKSDNRPENLVICQDQAYHLLLHVRHEALAACGDANKRQCPFCRKWADLSELNGGGRRSSLPHHRICAAAWQRAHRLEMTHFPTRAARRRAVGA